MDGAKLLEQAIPRRAHQAAQQAVNRTAQSDDLFHASPPSARCPPARAQKIIVFFLFVVCTALVIIPPLDFRFGWSSVPWYISVIGDALVAFSFYIFYLVSKVNTYAAANVRVEEGQQVVSTGMYALVRHPIYLGALFLVIGTPLALGSWWALLLVLLSVPVLYFRIANEEKVLIRGLPGYIEYTQRVRYRLIPFIW